MGEARLTKVEDWPSQVELDKHQLLRVLPEHLLHETVNKQVEVLIHCSRATLRDLKLHKNLQNLGWQDNNNN